MDTIIGLIAREVQVGTHQVEAAVRLLAEGATVPFIARYRKEATGGLTTSHLRLLEEHLYALQELEERRAAIFKSIDEQGKLTPTLHHALTAATTKGRLEDLYLPFRPKRRSRAAAAREAGLEPLAQALLADPRLMPESEASRVVNPGKGVPDGAAALDGARWILMEQFSEDPDVLARLREYVWERSAIESRVVPGNQEKGAKFADYFAAVEPVRSVPSHRALAMFRGRKEGILRLTIVLEPTHGAATAAAGPAPPHEATAVEATAVEATHETASPAPSVPEQLIAERFGVKEEGRAADAWLRDVVRRTWRMKVFPYLQVEVEKQVREKAEREAIRMFGRNLRDLLLAAPAGPRVTMGLDPGLRTGVKAAVIDAAGGVMATATVFPHQPKNDWEQAIKVLADLAREHQVELVSIGNGTGSRETDRLVGDLIKRNPDLELHKVAVSEAGASAYAVSRCASRELPGVEVALRGAVSIARRLQDPLVELVKIEPRSIAVGQYQHDVNQAHLARALGGVMEDCVNAVGADLNAASPSVLGRVSGLTRRLADVVVAFRNTAGPFHERRELMKVPGIGEKTFEQAAGFLRIRDGLNALDASGVHPEAYSVVERISGMTGMPVADLIGQADLLAQLAPAQLTDERFGEPTIRDILAELAHPNRDPRPQFRTACFAEGVEELEHLHVGMTLEGVVTNVASFGAFVDIGVHQDGLVHVSRLADRFVKDPRDVVKTGDIVRVRVVEVDLKRRRIALTMRIGTGRAARTAAQRRPKTQPGPGAATKTATAATKLVPPHPDAVPKLPPVETAMSAAFSRLLKRP